MKIVDLICTEGLTGFFFDDQKAIREGAKADGNAYIGEPKTAGFTSVRQPGESVSIMLILEDGQVAYGDCVAVQYSGAGGRDPLFLAKDYIPVIEREYKPLFVGKELNSFRELAELCDKHDDSVTKKHMHTAARYGMSQALLDAVAKKNKTTMAQVLAEEYDLKVSETRVPIFSQSGDDRYLNADKMILKSVDILPHALFNSVEKLGQNGEHFLEYLQWLVNRIEEIKTYEEYNPIIHIDVYGTIGFAFNDDLDRIVEFLKEAEKIAKPHLLRIEGPIDLGEREKHLKGLAELTRKLEEANVSVELVADEWCNTLEDVKEFVDKKAGHMIQIKAPDLGSIHNSLEAILYCKENGRGSYLGGTCNGTDRSGQISVNIAMAGQPDQVLAKPGMGVDEGVMIAYNEMNRIIALQKVLNK